MGRNLMWMWSNRRGEVSWKPREQPKADHHPEELGTLIWALYKTPKGNGAEFLQNTMENSLFESTMGLFRCRPLVKASCYVIFTSLIIICTCTWHSTVTGFHVAIISCPSIPHQGRSCCRPSANKQSFSLSTPTAKKGESWHCHVTSPTSLVAFEIIPRAPFIGWSWMLELCKEGLELWAGSRGKMGCWGPFLALRDS